MRIALIDPSLFTLPYDRELMSGLRSLGNDVTLHGRTLRSGDEDPGSIPISTSFYRISESRFGRALPSPLRLGLKGVDHGWSTWRLFGSFLKDPPDIIHFQWLPLPLLDRLFLDRFRQIAPLVLTVHDTNPFNGEASAAIQRRAMPNCIEQFDRIIVHTEQGKERLTRAGLPATRITVLPHGMLAEPVVSAPDPMRGRVTFLLFGKIRPYKGADTLIDAFIALPADLRQAARLRIVGKPYMDIAPLLARANQAGVEIDIETGYVPDAAIAELFAPGTIAMFPYREIEASGVLFLALAHGRPIIASRLGSFAELVKDGMHGHLVAPGDIASLTRAMEHMLNDRDFAAGCAANVSELAAAIPAWQDIASRTLDVYRSTQAARPKRKSAWAASQRAVTKTEAGLPPETFES